MLSPLGVFSLTKAYFVIYYEGLDSLLGIPDIGLEHQKAKVLALAGGAKVKSLHLHIYQF